MEIIKLGEVAILAHVRSEALEEPAIRIRLDGVEDGSAITVYKSGRKDKAKCYTAQNGIVSPSVEPAKYTLCIGSAKVRFTVFEQDGKLYVKRSKEDPEQTLEKIFQLCLEMLSRIDAQNKRLETIDGYETE